MSEAKNANSLLWGFDGGGTKTTVMLAESVPGGPPRVLASIRAGSSNVNSRPWSEITTDLAGAVSSASQVAERSSGSAAALVAAFAGVGTPSVRKKWEGWFDSQNFAREVRIVDDGEPLIAAGLPDGWGVVLIAGTGSVAFGRSPSGAFDRAGGWGYLFGDEGSGFAIGRAALRDLTHAFDLGSDLAPWMQTLCEDWVIVDPRSIVERVYGAEEPRQCVAKVARIVCEAAVRGDEQAQHTLQVAAGDLAVLVEKVAQSLGLTGQPFPLALSGGVIANSLYLQREMENSLLGRGLSPGPVTVVTEPVLGCIALAERIALK